MDALLLLSLLLGTTPGEASNEPASSRARVQAVASAKILGGEMIHLGEAVHRGVATDSRDFFQLAAIRSSGEIAIANGETIQLQEFH